MANYRIEPVLLAAKIQLTFVNNDSFWTYKISENKSFSLSAFSKQQTLTVTLV